MDEAPVRGAGIQLHGHREVAVERSASCAPGIGFPRPANFRSNTGPPPPQNRFAGAAITGGRGSLVAAGRGRLSFCMYSGASAGGGRMAGLRPLAVPVDARHGPSTSRASCTHRPRCRQMELLDSDDHGEARHAVRLPRNLLPQPVKSTIRGRGRPAHPGSAQMRGPFCPWSGSDFGRLVLRACGVPRLHVHHEVLRR